MKTHPVICFLGLSSKTSAEVSSVAREKGGEMDATTGGLILVSRFSTCYYYKTITLVKFTLSFMKSLF